MTTRTQQRKFGILAMSFLLFVDTNWHRIRYSRSMRTYLDLMIILARCWLSARMNNPYNYSPEGDVTGCWRLLQQYR
jgi:hypothetical protein